MEQGGLAMHRARCQVQGYKQFDWYKYISFRKKGLNMGMIGLNIFYSDEKDEVQQFPVQESSQYDKSEIVHIRPVSQSEVLCFK